MKRIAIALCVLGITGFAVTGVAEDYPQGCVDCHVQGNNMDMRLNTLLANIGHGRGGERTKIIPEGCTRCHASDDQGSAGSLRKLIHSIHYETPEVNAFMTQHAGDCRHCHSMDSQSGRAALKSGERNWSLQVVESK